MPDKSAFKLLMKCCGSNALLFLLNKLNSQIYSFIQTVT